MELSHGAVVAEWLRRLTRNQFPSGSAGSNPADCDIIFMNTFPIDGITMTKFCHM